MTPKECCNRVSFQTWMNYETKDAIPFPKVVFHISNKFIWSKEELPDQWKESIIVPVHKKGDKTD
jgi:hypothetical protein